MSGKVPLHSFYEVLTISELAARRRVPLNLVAGKTMTGEVVLTDEKFWGVKEVAEYLQLPYKTVLLMIKRGLPAVKMGKVYRIAPADVRAWYASQQKTGA